jgi:hypothetical protein
VSEAEVWYEAGRGLLAAGWYGATDEGGRCGPFATKQQADAAIEAPASDGAPSWRRYKMRPRVAGHPVSTFYAPDLEAAFACARAAWPWATCFECLGVAS